MVIYCILNRTCRIGEPATEPKYMSFHASKCSAEKELEFDYQLAVEEAQSFDDDYFRDEVHKTDKGYHVNCYVRGELTKTEYYYIEHRIAR